MKKFLIVACLALGMTACSNDDNKQDKGFESVIITMDNVMQGSLIAKGEMGGPYFADELFTVITNQTDWQNLIDQMNSVDPTAPETDVDFNNYEVIAVFDEGKTTGGYSIDIINITEFEKEIEVEVDRLHKGNDTQIATKPFHIVKIPKINKPVVFVEVD
ncbi:protease complex subunit PrcB family protein [Myroides indicus]|nr:protease complex subunit PrcB family protein [Myroides indicus]